MQWINFSVIARWRDILLYALFGSVLPSVAFYTLPNVSYEWKAGPRYVVILTLGLLVLVVLHSIAGFRLRHLRVSHRYPSFVFGPISTMAVLLLFGGLAPGYGVFTSGDALEALGIYAVVLAIVGAIRELSDLVPGLAPREKIDHTLPPSTLGELRIEEVLAWAESEDPIRSSSEDLSDSFNFRFRADRVLATLRKLPGFWL